jgi:hypothetical protein
MSSGSGARYRGVTVITVFALSFVFTPVANALAPVAPSAVTAVAGDASATVSWVASVGADSYTVTSSPGGRTCTTTSLTCSMTSLTNGTAYTFTATATNADGSSAASSPSAAVTPMSVVVIPSAPTGVTAVAGEGLATVAWVASVGADSYTVTSSPGGFTCTTALLTCSVVGLSNGTSYTFTVAGTNTAGTSGPSLASPSVIPLLALLPPVAPIGVTAVAGEGLATVAWVASVGADSYVVTSTPGGFTCTTALLTCSVVGLSNGTSYTFTVTAANIAGTSAASSPTLAVTPILALVAPTAPTGVTAVAGEGLATVAWVASVGADSYTVTSTPGGFTCATALLTCSVIGLANGTSYTFKVIGTNSAGTSPPSAASPAATPVLALVPPVAPTGVTAVAGEGLATVAWVASVGADSYTVTSSPGGFTCTTALLTCSVAGLSNGTAYTFAVTGANTAGTSALSSASLAVTPLLALVAPVAPTGVTAVAGEGLASVSWAASVGSDSYTVTSSPGGFTCTTALLTCSVTGLTNGTSYTFKVTGTNSVGTSASSAPSPAATPRLALVAPVAPTGVTAVAGGGLATVAWLASVGSDFYTVTSSPDGLTCTTALLTCSIAGLSNGTAYTFKVTGTNTVGTSPSSAASLAVTPLPEVTIPTAPAGVTAVAGEGLATVAWIASVGVDSYKVTSSPGGFTCTTTLLTCWVTGLSNGTAYVFTVTASNTVGTSATSLTTASVTPSLAVVAPTAPAGVTAVAGEGLAAVSWAASVGADSYTVTSSPGGFTCTTALLTCSVNGLKNGTAYTFQVTGTNSVGTSPASAASSAVTPKLALIPPTTPTGVTAVASEGIAAVSWVGSVSADFYTVTSSPGGLTCTTTFLTCSVAGLSNGTPYAFSITASNSVGTSSPSAPSAAVVPVVAKFPPSTPTGVTASAGEGFASVAWLPSAGAASYTVTSSPGGFTCTTALLTCSVAGLSNGTPYTFRVTTSDSAGTSSASAPSAAVVPVVARRPPPTPTGITTVAGNGLATVAWLPSIGAVSYTVTSTPGGFTCTTALLTCSVAGLSNGKPYTFRVTARDSAGASAASSATSPIIPLVVPPPPSAVVAVAGDRLAVVSWVNAVGAASYTVTSQPDGITCTTSLLSCAISPLTDGLRYTFTVTARNSAGTSSASLATAAVSPLTPPMAPTTVSAEAGDASALVSWPASVGATSYVVSSNPAGSSCRTALLTCSVSSLSNGQPYTFTVIAMNVAGSSPVSVASNAVTPAKAVTVPMAPTGVAAVPADGLVTVSWAGSIGATSYTVTSVPGGRTCSTSSLKSCVVSALKDETPYKFTVTAKNAIGASVASAASAAVTPLLARTAPETPAQVRAVGGDNFAVIGWAASLGAASYTVTSSPGKFSCTTSLLTCSVASLVDGESYTFTVSAKNAAGKSAASAASNAVIPQVSGTTPLAPVGLSAVAGNGLAIVSWTAPPGAIFYTVTSSPGGRTCTTSLLTYCVVSSLANDTAYTFSVTATNVGGTSSASLPSAAVTPRLAKAAIQSLALAQISARAVTQAEAIAGASVRAEISSAVKITSATTRTGAVVVSLKAPAGGAVELIMKASRTGATRLIPCRNSACVIGATKLSIAQTLSAVTTFQNGEAVTKVVAAFMTSVYPDNIHLPNRRLLREIKAFAKSIKGRGGIVTIVGSHSYASHDAYGVRMANLRAKVVAQELRKLGVEARINRIKVTAKTVQGGLAAAVATWRP